MKIGSSSQGMCLCYNQTMTYINKETTGKERNQLIRNILLAIRELNQSNEVNTNTKDLIAYIALNLKEIYRGIDMTVQAWEKRDYWVKADKYRMEWMWTDSTSAKITKALLAENYVDVISALPKILEKFQETKLPKSAKLPDDYVGSFEKLRKASE